MNNILRLIGSVLFLAMGGCAAGPNFQRPLVSAPQSYVPTPLPSGTASAPGIGGAAQRFVQGQEVQAQWWTVFGSPALNELVTAALQANPDLQAAEAALRAARSTVAAQRGAYWPGVDAGVNTNREKVAGPVSGPLDDGDVKLYTLHTAQLSIGYVPDVFGANRRQVEALSAEADVQRFQREAVYMTLVSNVVGAAIEEANLRGQIDATRDLIALSARLLDVTRRQYNAGQVGGVDVVAQEAALARVQVTLPPLEKQLAEQRNLLATLIGRLPGEGVPQRFELASLSLPEELPLSLPSRLVEQRPDIRAAEAQLHVASALVGVAAAARLPSFTLTASLGRSSLDFSQMLRNGGAFWTVGADLFQPVFRGRMLRLRQRAAEAAFDQAAAQYRSTVLTAFQNTADALQAIVSDAETLRAASAAEAAARRSLTMTQRSRELGAASQVELIVAQQNYQEAATALVQAQANRFTSTVALFHALGGGWWHSRSETDAVPTAGDQSLRLH